MANFTSAPENVTGETAAMANGTLDNSTAQMDDISTPSLAELTTTVAAAVRRGPPVLVGTWDAAYDNPALAMYIVVMCLGVSNLAVVLSYFRSSKLKTPFNALVVAMAISDLVVNYVIVPMDLYQLLQKLVAPAGKQWCKPKLFFGGLCQNFTIFLMVAFSVICMQYDMMVAPPSVSRCKSIFISVLSFLAAAMFAATALPMESTRLLSCLGRIRGPDDLDDQVFRLYVFFMLIFFVVTFICYALMLIGFCTSDTEYNEDVDPELVTETDPEEVRARKVEMRLSIMTRKAAVGISILLLAFWSIPILPAIKPLKESIPVLSTYHFLSLLYAVGCLHSCFKPFVYMWFSPNYSDVLLSLLPGPLGTVLKKVFCVRASVEPAPQSTTGTPLTNVAPAMGANTANSTLPVPALPAP